MAAFDMNDPEAIVSPGMIYLLGCINRFTILNNCKKNLRWRWFRYKLWCSFITYKFV